MADDLNPTPADSRASAPVAEPGADEPSTKEIVALVVTGTDAEGGAVTPTPTTAKPDGTAAYPSPTKVSNETPTITKPAPRPAPVPRPAPPSATAPPPTVTPPPRPTTAPARPESDWAAEVADRIDEVVAKVRANTSDRLVGVARMVVYGLLAAVMGITALVLVLILFFRLLAIIPGPVWIPYLGLGAIFVLVGLLCWSKRTAKPSPA